MYVNKNILQHKNNCCISKIVVFKEHYLVMLQMMFIIHKLSKSSSVKVKFLNPSSTFLFKRYILERLAKHSLISSMFLIRKNIVVRSVSFLTAFNLWSKWLSSESSARKLNVNGNFSSSFSLEDKPQPIRIKMQNIV